MLRASRTGTCSGLNWGKRCLLRRKIPDEVGLCERLQISATPIIRVEHTAAPAVPVMDVSGKGDSASNGDAPGMARSIQGADKTEDTEETKDTEETEERPYHGDSGDRLKYVEVEGKASGKGHRENARCQAGGRSGWSEAHCEETAADGQHDVNVCNSTRSCYDSEKEKQGPTQSDSDRDTDAATADSGETR